MAEQEKRTDPVTHTDSAAKIDTSVDMQLESLRKWLRDTQIALIALAESIDDNCPAINGPGYPKVVRERLGCVGPIPPPPQPEAKHEGLKWGCKLLPSKTGMSGKGVYSPSGKYYLYGLSPSHAWAVGDKDETYTHFPSDAAALAALNACTQPPPDFVEPAKPEAVNTAVSASDIHGDEPEDCNPFGLSGSNTAVHVSMPAKPEAGEQRVCRCGHPRSSHGLHGDGVCLHGGIEDCFCHCLQFSTPQPAEPKVMPQPSEQAKGAEWLPPHMEQAWYRAASIANWSSSQQRETAIKAWDAEWRTFIESERAQHKAEMEAAKKGASR